MLSSAPARRHRGGATSPTVTVITPAFNAARYLNESVESVIAQGFVDWELLIIDDGSTDATREIARRHAANDTRVHVVETDHVGVAAARNAGMREGRGVFFALLDSDDVWLPDFLAAQMDVFKRMPATDVVTSNAFNLGGRRDGEPLHPVVAGFPSIAVLDMIQREDAVCIMSVFRRKVFETVGGFDQNLLRSEDYEFWIRAAQRGFHFVENPQPLGRYRRRPESASSDELAMLDAIVQVLKRTRQAGVSHVEIAAIDRQLARLRERQVLERAKRSLLSRQYQQAAQEFDTLSGIRRNFESRVIAQASRWLPAMLRWAYRTKSALRV